MSPKKYGTLPIAVVSKNMLKGFRKIGRKICAVLKIFHC